MYICSEIQYIARNTTHCTLSVSSHNKHKYQHPFRNTNSHTSAGVIADFSVKQLPTHQPESKRSRLPYKEFMHINHPLSLVETGRSSQGNLQTMKTRIFP